jgi:hypothetical protein
VAWGDDVTNASSPGVSAQDLVDRDSWQGAIPSSENWWLLIGSNDIARGTHPFYEENVRSLLSEMHSLGARQIHLMHSPPLWEGFGGPQKVVPELLEQREIDLSICLDTGYVVCGPDLYDLLDQREHFTYDGVHMSELGKQVTADAVVPEPAAAASLLAALLALLVVARLRTRGVRAARRCRGHLRRARPSVRRCTRGGQRRRRDRAGAAHLLVAAAPVPGWLPSRFLGRVRQTPP